MFVNLKGLGTDHVTWCWGAEEDYQTKLHSMAQNLTNIATYRLNCPRSRFMENAILSIADVKW